MTVLAQSSQNQSDLLGQDPVTETEVPVAAPKRVSITNRPVATDQAAEGDVAEASKQRPAKEAVRKSRPVVQSEFQKFVLDSTGTALPIFGSEFFASAPSTFSPLANAPVVADYALGPGDELMIRGWGSIDIDYRATIDRNGLISIPTIGSVALAGVRAGDAEGVIRNAVARLYKDVTVNVNFGRLRSITVYVVGQASRPGTYNVSSLSTLVTALFASGGPNANGSMRHVQIKRGGKVAAELDLYSFIGKGDKSTDIRLQDGDTIFIPTAVGHVALVGKVNTPAIYELKTASDTIESLLAYAGGVPVVADPRRAFLERIDASRNQPRSVEQFALDGAGLKRTLKDGDVLNVTSITPDFSNAVVLRGNVDQAVRAPFKAGMRISDLIPSRQYLITRNSIKRQNNVVNAGEERQTNEASESIASRIGGLIDEINWDYAVVERMNRSDLSVSLVPFNLGNVFTNPSGPDNVQLQPGDTVTIFSQQDVAVPMDKRRIFVRVEGEVNVPGVYQMTAGETLQSMLSKAGGTTSNAYLFGTAFYREEVRRQQELNLEKLVKRLESQARADQSRSVANARSTADVQLAEVRRQADAAAAAQAIARLSQLKPTGRIAFGLDPREKRFATLPQLKLENGDRLVIPAKPEFIYVFGAVNVESSPLWRPGDRVNDYLKKVGLTAEADEDNIFLLRVDGSVVSRDSGSWLSGGFGGTEVMPGDCIVVPEKFDKETRWTKFMTGAREWTQILANFGLGAAAFKTLRD
ncbi:polysaccharide biosynthesis/export family protein [Janthinobacterium lividum]|uniref:polysaccharide biosynthesis/export family protein n=1 Tax=Janthinobacterium lividum TaxID=29581 RepID=UPI001F0D6014|nr:SLBB domain-containing protein [Janthinobacterium lividum]